MKPSCRTSHRRRNSILVGAAATMVSAVGVTHAAPLTFAVIGDYGRAPQYSSPPNSDPGEQYVAKMVNGWNPSFIATVGDNNYGDDGEDDNYTDPTVISNNINAYYGSYITGSQSTNKFFPVLGNADWGEEGGNAASPNPEAWYETEFKGLPSNGNAPGIDHRYYTVSEGFTSADKPLVQFFMLDDDSHDLDFNTSSALAATNSVEGQWLKTALAASTALYKIVITHHAPYTSGDAGSTPDTELPYKTWGATAVLSGHAHIYERLSEPDPGMADNTADDLPYLVDGLGGDSIQGFGPTTLAGSQYQYQDSHGALEVMADDSQLQFQFWSVDDSGTNPKGQPPGRAYSLLDSLTIAAPTAAPEPSSATLLFFACAGLIGVRRRRAVIQR